MYGDLKTGLTNKACWGILRADSTGRCVASKCRQDREKHKQNILLKKSFKILYHIYNLTLKGTEHNICLQTLQFYWMWLKMGVSKTRPYPSPRFTGTH